MGTSDCSFFPIFCEGNKYCSGSCLGIEMFNCSKFISFSTQNICYLFDINNLSKQFFKDPSALNGLYLKDCKGSIPSIAYNEVYFEGTNDNEAIAKINSENSIFKAEPGCIKDCYSECCSNKTDHDIITSNEISKCIIYEEYSDYFNSQEVHKIYKKCLPEQKNVQYSEWSDCNERCTQFKERIYSFGVGDTCNIATMPVKIIRICTGGMCPNIILSPQNPDRV